MSDPLPQYKGRLGPAPWSAVRLTAANLKALAEAAEEGCRGCKGTGYVGGPEFGEVCHCVHRPKEK